MVISKRTFFCGIGGSGMLPLAMIVRARGGEVWGSDRSLDQGRVSAKFAWLEEQGIRLFPQDGSGVQSPEQTIIASAAVEDSVPDIARAAALGCPRLTRADLNSALFNAATVRIGVGGTSGKSTVTGMIGWILDRSGRTPTVMNGAVMRNFATPDNPFASALVGGSETYVSEVDESDGSIAHYAPTIAVVTNISLDHKSLGELHQLFGDFAAKADFAVVNADDAESTAMIAALSAASPRHACTVTTFGMSPAAAIRADDVRLGATGTSFTVNADGQTHSAAIAMPGQHNVVNALAAIAACAAAGISAADSIAALASFTGLARRYEVVGSANGITVIDDFAHNPDKIAATLATVAATVAATGGRALLFFQPHGYGPLRQMGTQLAAAFAAGMRVGDKLFVCDPVYFGGTVDRSVGSKSLVSDVIGHGGYAVYMSQRQSCGEALVREARAGDRILILGARDDTLTEFAAQVLAAL